MIRENNGDMRRVQESAGGNASGATVAVGSPATAPGLSSSARTKELDMSTRDSNYPTPSSGGQRGRRGKRIRPGQAVRRVTYMVQQVASSVQNVTKTAVVFFALGLVATAATESSGVVHDRLMQLGWLAVWVLLAATALVIAWRFEWPQLPELPIPVIMI